MNKNLGYPRLWQDFP